MKPSRLKIFLLAVFLAIPLVSCNKLKGDKGDKGDSGPGNILIFSGSIPDDDFTRTINVHPDLIGTMNVYIQDGGGDFIQLPVFIPGDGVNALPIYTPGTTNGTLRILNAELAGGVVWQVVVITK